MLSYAEQAAITEYLVSIYDRIELELLENLISAVKKTRYGGATEWRTQMLERMGWYNKKNVAAIAKKTGKTQQEIRKIFKDLGLHALTNEETLYQTAFSRGLLPARPVNLAESAAISQILDAAIANADSYLNLVNTTCAEAARSAYMDVVNKVYIETVTGIKDYSSAIRHAVNNLAKNGLTTVTYYRKDGKKINYPVDAAVRRNIMTSIGQTTGKMQLSRAEEWGCNYMEVTSHFGARPSHAEWQGQVYMINGSSTEYKNLAEATGYGTGEGLKGWNCRHDMYPFVPGISVRGSFPIDLKENEKEYKLTQQQRALESEVRQLRRECVAAENLGDKVEFTNKSMELKDKQTELNNFLEKNKRTQAARVSTAGYNRSVSGKVTWTSKKALKKIEKNVILTENEMAAITDYISSESYKINYVLRQNAVLEKYQEVIIDNLDAALKKLPNYDGTVYRSMRSEEMESYQEFAELHKRGNIVTYPAYTSTSIEVYDKDMDVQLVIKSKKGKDIRDYNCGEQEILFGRNSKFVVTEIVNNTIYMEEL